MKRCVASVATGRYVVGQRRLIAALRGQDTHVACWMDTMPPGSPSHQDTPYGFKAYAVADVVSRGYDLVLWADACIVPRDLTPLWDRIERDGYWISNNGYWNYEWTCKEAYPLLGVTEEENKQIRHVVATAFGLNLSSEIGKEAFEEYFRLAKNGAFRGPWTGGVQIQHRHDQTALSVVAHRLKMKLTDPPAWFAYKGGETAETVLIADGAY